MTKNRFIQLFRNKVVIVVIIFAGVTVTILFLKVFFFIPYKNLRCGFVIWHTYQNSTYRFRLRYPSSWAVHEFPQPGQPYNGLPKALFAMTVDRLKSGESLILQIHQSPVSIKDREELGYTKSGDRESLILEIENSSYFTQYFFTFGSGDSSKKLGKCQQWIGDEILQSIQLY